MKEELPAEDFENLMNVSEVGECSERDEEAMKREIKSEVVRTLKIGIKLISGNCRK